MKPANLVSGERQAAREESSQRSIRSVQLGASRLTGRYRAYPAILATTPTLNSS